MWISCGGKITIYVSLFLLLPVFDFFVCFYENMCSTTPQHYKNSYILKQEHIYFVPWSHPFDLFDFPFQKRFLESIKTPCQMLRRQRQHSWRAVYAGSSANAAFLFRAALRRRVGPALSNRYFRKFKVLGRGKKTARLILPIFRFWTKKIQYRYQCPLLKVAKRADSLHPAPLMDVFPQCPNPAPLIDVFPHCAPTQLLLRMRFPIAPQCCSYGCVSSAFRRLRQESAGTRPAERPSPRTASSTMRRSGSEGWSW